jgi:hypothetical protein
MRTGCCKGFDLAFCFSAGRGLGERTCLEAFWFPGRRNGNGAGGAITGSAVVLLICSSYWLSLEVVFLVRV